ncbi:MAG TPA: dTMP kinase [Gemmatimonadaceae bacterium]
MSGALIVLEGVEGAGKTTQAARLVRRLEAAGMECVAVREPGGTQSGDVIRRLLLDPDSRLDARTEALLFMASRAQLVADAIRPALARGAFVIADRFFLSTYAYQIAGRGLPEAAVREANALATGGLVPDLNVLLDLPSGDGLARARQRSGADRIERSGADFHDRVRQAFVGFASASWQSSHPEAGAIALIDASGSEVEVAARVAAELARQWPRTAAALAGSNS